VVVLGMETTRTAIFAFSEQGLRFQRQLHFGAGGDDDGLRFFLQADFRGLGQHIGAFVDRIQTAGVLGSAVALGQVRQVLAAAASSAVGRLAFCKATAQATAVSAVSAGRQTSRPGIRRKRGRMLDGLVGGTVFAQADASRV
jgi:hypothetical protein